MVLTYTSPHEHNAAEHRERWAFIFGVILAIFLWLFLWAESFGTMVVSVNNTHMSAQAAATVLADVAIEQDAHYATVTVDPVTRTAAVGVRGSAVVRVFPAKSALVSVSVDEGAQEDTSEPNICDGIDLAIMKYSTCVAPFDDGGYARGGGGGGGASGGSPESSGGTGGDTEGDTGGDTGGDSGQSDPGPGDPGPGPGPGPDGEES